MVCSSCSSNESIELPSISLGDLSINEGNDDKIIFVTVSLSRIFDQKVIAEVSTQSETAIDGLDFNGVTDLRVEFLPGELTQSVPINIIGDREFEQDEYFRLKVVTVENAKTVADSSTVTLINDDEGTLKLIWSDNFDGTSLNTEYWTYETGPNWFNNELQYYSDQNVTVSDGKLTIEARGESVEGRNYTSSRIKTQDKFEFQYGRVDIRASLPEGQGLWPALWMLGSNISEVNWPACGEIDIMEMIGGQGRENTVYGTLHWQDPNGDPGNSFHAQTGSTYSLSTGTFSGDFHVFSIIWDETSIKWYVDEVLSHEISITPPDLSEFHQPYFFIFNVAVGGDFPGNPDNSTVFPQQMIVDYVRVYQEQ